MESSSTARCSAPLFVEIKGLPILVIGGGAVAERKVVWLLANGAKIRVVSPKTTQRLSALVRAGAIERIARPFLPGDLKGAALIYVCTSNPCISRSVADWARREGRLVNLADLPEASSFFVPSAVVRGDLIIAISTGGRSPALARKIRIDLEHIFGDEYADLLRILWEVRKRLLRRRRGKISKRTAIFRELVESDLLALLRSGRRREAAARVRGITGLADFRMPSPVGARRKG